MTSPQDFLTKFTKALIAADPLERQNIVADYARKLEAREAEIGKQFYERFGKGLNLYDKELDALTPEQMLCVLECAKNAANIEGDD